MGSLPMTRVRGGLCGKRGGYIPWQEKTTVVDIIYLFEEMGERWGRKERRRMVRADNYFKSRCIEIQLNALLSLTRHQQSFVAPSYWRASFWQPDSHRLGLPSSTWYDMYASLPDFHHLKVSSITSSTDIQSPNCTLFFFYYWHASVEQLY